MTYQARSMAMMYENENDPRNAIDGTPVPVDERSGVVCMRYATGWWKRRIGIKGSPTGCMSANLMDGPISTNP